MSKNWRCYMAEVTSCALQLRIAGFLSVYSGSYLHSYCTGLVAEQSKIQVNTYVDVTD